ncbi:hypothetical protein C7S20_17440 [Christiangramia fulva]|uniref:Glycosyltransferase n=1 Tax=Christiangramia fulva TaxID=2126553 RepID=A0A2R3Z9E2_9FLAO|nr:glycosyltransferase [Christiangramia fulva]AVR46901.1 hypothetical protein C7S20_17440 [Christiangramia fulva]
MNLIIYRGPLERARLAFLFETLKERYTEINFIWISPRVNEGDRKYYSDLFISEYSFNKTLILEHRYQHFFLTNRAIKNFIGNSDLSFLGLIGFSSLEFGYSLEAEKTVWFINGVPEEKTFSENSFIQNKKVDLLWFIKKTMIKNIDLVVTVSHRMNSLVKSRLQIEKVFAAPTCVDTTVFGDYDVQKAIDFCYLGSGAVWQALDLVSEIWDELYKRDSSLKFRVISRDERTEILAKNIPSSNIEFVSSHKFEEVAKYIAECKAGFLIRKDHIVNRVCFPTKLAEYLASNCYVVSTEIDWDIKDYFDRYNIGLLVCLNESPEAMAKRIFEFHREFKNSSLDIEECTKQLDRDIWKKKLKLQLN